MIRNFVLAGGLLWTILLVTTVAGQNCTGNEPIVDPPVMVVKYGGPAKANCSVPYPTLNLGWEATMGVTSKANAMQLDWRVDKSDWTLGDGLQCYVNSHLHGQCLTKLSITIYKIPESVSLSLNHTGPLVEGQRYLLQCDVKSVAPAKNLTIIWYRGDTKLEQSDFTQFSSEGNLTRKSDINVTADLWITASRDDHEVSYSCEAKLNLNTTELIPGTRSIAPPLEVLYRPTTVNSTSNVILTEGERLVLECIANGNPEPTYEWRHDNYFLLNATNSTLIIESTETSNSGSYNCTAKNIIGEISAKIDVQVSTNYLPWIAIAVAIAIAILLAVLIGMYCSYHKKNKTGAYILTKFKFGASQNGQVAHANGYP